MENVIKSQGKEPYIFPDIVILDIETEQNILANGSGNGDAPKMNPIIW